MATSGTVSTTIFRTNKVIEHAYARCRIARERITPERIQTALDLLFLRLSSMVNRGIALWAVEKQLIPLYAAQQSVELPVGTVDLLNCNLRSLQRLSGIASASEGDAENAFDGDLETACTQTLADGYIQLELETAIQATNFGLMPNATGTWNFVLQASDDGSTWTTFYTATDFAAVAGKWTWWDVEGMGEWLYYRMLATDGTILDVTELVLGNMPQEIPCAPINRDDYANMPNKFFLGRPVQYWYDKQRVQPVVTLWPAPGAEYTFYQLVAYVQRYIQDVGTLRQEVEVPQSWYLALVARLAADIALEDDEVDPQLVATLDAIGERTWKEAWDGQSDGSSVYLRPNIRPYTA